ncbi:hypothetical protein ILUMI_23781 [Ignelater luminosus]|uniref:Alpha-methylacyl-CoA racemase n=1 Tax=Ignelater luminosus TaxID=2038154 RepID=A0A8K0CBH4_IGNLU|nr:hypothetical protein ILUMI_23781 [Ignelater luminosus]
MALKGIKVIELAGLAPAPFCGMVLADFGASVIRIDRVGNHFEADCVANGKQSLALNLRHPEGVGILRKLSKNCDVLIEPYRKGVMEKLGIGPTVLLKDNPKLIYARLTGYGQEGKYSARAGHDINYIGISGLLSLFGRFGEKPLFPVNAVADFAGGGLMCALGIILALFERQSSGIGQVVDCNMVEGSAYLGSWLYRSQNLPIWGNPRGKNIIDSGAHFYETYETKDGKFMAVGAIEPQFYKQLLEGLGLTEENVPQFPDFERGKQIFTAKFLEKTQDEWSKIFDGRDACVTPILSLDEAPKHEHNTERKSFIQSWNNGRMVPIPAPILCRTPGESQCVNPPPQRGQQTEMILKDLGYDKDGISKLENDGVIETYKMSKL